jgi:hypothetical protein
VLPENPEALSVPGVMSDRLAELRRQRAIVAEHLAWLDRQITEASGQSGAAPAPPTPTAPAQPEVPSWPRTPVPPTEAAAVVAAALKARAATVTTTSAPEAPVVEAAAETILDEYRTSPDNLKTDLRKGCFLYFFGALALIAGGVAVLWFIFSRNR